MKKISLIFISFLFLTNQLFSQNNPNHIYVDGYINSNGNYVKGYYKTTPNSTINDNFSTKPNINPYTGKHGSIEPESQNNYDIDTRGIVPIEDFELEYARTKELTKNIKIRGLDRFLPESERITYPDMELYNNKVDVPKSSYIPVYPEVKIPKINTSDYESDISEYSFYQDAINYHNMKYNLDMRLAIEVFLKQLNVFEGNVDGYFDKSTIESIKKAQRFLGLEDDGKMGVKSLSKAIEYIEYLNSL